MNAAGDGWTARLVMRGAHGGKSYAVYRHGRLVTRISGHASYGALALTRAEAELRRLGCPLPRFITKKKETTMPRLTGEEEQQTTLMRTRLTELIASSDRGEVIRRALELMDQGAAAGECRPLDGTPKGRREIVDRGLFRLLDEGKGWKQINIDRWDYVLAHWSNGNTPVPVAEEPAQVAPAPSGAIDPETAEMLQAAEEMLKSAEDERDEARASLTKLEGQLANQEKALGLLTESKDGRIAELELVVENQRTTIDEQTTKIAELEDATASLHELASFPYRSTARSGAFQERYFAVLVDHLVRCSNVNDATAGVLLRRLDALVGIEVTD